LKIGQYRPYVTMRCPVSRDCADEAWISPMQ